MSPESKTSFRFGFRILLHGNVVKCCSCADHWFRITPLTGSRLLAAPVGEEKGEEGEETEASAEAVEGDKPMA